MADIKKELKKMTDPFKARVEFIFLPLVSSEREHGSYNCTPFLHSLLTKGKYSGFRISEISVLEF